MIIKNDDKRLSVDVIPIEISEITFRLLGITPLICNRQSEKAKHSLLLPEPRKNKAQREQTLKHEPLVEFRASPYRNRDASEPTLLHMPGGMFKKCLSQAAIDIPGASKAQIGRLVSLVSTQINLYGVPHLRADMVRQAGMTRTPDVRFRACLPEWACEVTYSYVASVITPNSIANLLSAAGVICGIGDYRVEKGAGDFGKFRIAVEDDPDWNRIVAEGGRDVQEAAMLNPIFYDDEARELLEWFDDEIDRRRKVPDIAISSRARKTHEEERVQ